MKTKILLIGGAGYIGTVVTEFFLKNKYQVTCLDNFIFNNEYAINSFRNSESYKLVKGDLRDEDICKKLIEDHDVIIILGGLVGDPITKKYPTESKQINSEGIKKLIEDYGKQILVLPLQGFIFFGSANRLLDRIKLKLQDANSEESLRKPWPMATKSLVLQVGIDILVKAR